MTIADRSFTLEFRSSNHNSISNWSGPGWYLYANEYDNHGTWLVRPQRIRPSHAMQIALAMGYHVHHLATEQTNDGLEQLRQRVKDYEKSVDLLHEAQAALAEYEQLLSKDIGE